MRFISESEKRLRFQLVPRQTIYEVEPVGEVDIPDEYAHAVALYGLPLIPIIEKPVQKVEPKIEQSNEQKQPDRKAPEQAPKK